MSVYEENSECGKERVRVRGGNECIIMSYFFYKVTTQLLIYVFKFYLSKKLCLILLGIEHELKLG
jgi:hypothetical protein